MNLPEISFAAVPFALAWLLVAILDGERFSLQRWYPVNVIAGCLITAVLGVLAVVSFGSSRPGAWPLVTGAVILGVAQVIVIVKTRRLNAEASADRLESAHREVPHHDD